MEYGLRRIEMTKKEFYVLFTAFFITTPIIMLGVVYDNVFVYAFFTGIKALLGLAVLYQIFIKKVDF